MKSFFFLLLFVASFIVSNLCDAQEAKLVKRGEWGSGSYEHLVEINGYYYIETTANQIDVIDPTIKGEESLIGQITLESDDYPYIYALDKFKDFLVVLTNNHLSFYRIADVTKLTLVYSIDVNSNGKDSIISRGDYLIYADSSNKIFILKNDANDFSLEKVIQSQSSDYRNNVYVYDQKLFESDSAFYLFYIKQDNSQTNTVIEQYNIDDFTLIDSAVMENIAINSVISVDKGRFVASSYDHLYLIKLVGGEVSILNDFSDEAIYNTFRLAFKNDILYAFSWNWQLRTFRLSDSDNITKINSESLNGYLSDAGYPSYFSWLNDELVVLASQSGVFNVTINDDFFVENINFLYNQSGYIGKAVIKNNFAYLPRQNRIDVLNVSDIEHPFLYGHTSKKAKNIDVINNDYIFSTHNSIANYSLFNTIDFDLNSKKDGLSINSYESLFYDTELYYIEYGQGYNLVKQNIATPYALYESANKAAFPVLTNSCPNALSILDDKLLAFDPCGNNRIHLFSHSGPDGFSYRKTLENNRNYWHVATVGSLIYFISPSEIELVKLNDDEELETVKFVELGIYSNSGIYLAKIIDDYLLLSNEHYLFLIDVSDNMSPRLISRTKINNWELTDVDIKLTGNNLVITTKEQGKVKFFQINKAPTFNLSTLTLKEDQESEPFALFTDPDSDQITYSFIQEASNGAAHFDNDEFIYTPNENFFGSDSVIIKAQDIHGNFIEHELNIEIDAVNDEPIILTDEIRGLEDTELVSLIEVFDVEGDQLSISIDELPANGSASLTDEGELKYLPDANYYGNDAITLLVVDSRGASSSKTITILVESVNDVPNVQEDSFEGEEDTTIKGQLSATDVDGHAVSFSVVVGSSVNGNVTIESNGQFVFTPDENFYGQASFIAQATDIEQGVTQQEIIINVLNIDDVPIAKDINVSVNQNGSVSNSIDIVDVDNEGLTYTLINDVTNGTLSLSSNGDYSYTPNAGYVGSDVFTYEVSDEKNTVQGTITISILKAPEANKSSSSSGGGSVGYMLIMMMVGLIYCRRLRILLS